MGKILAKSKRTFPDGTVVEITLAQHTRQVIEAAKSLFGDENPTQLGQQWLRFFRIPDQWATFRKNLIAACALHDLGKANDSFQKTLAGGAIRVLRMETE